MIMLCLLSLLPQCLCQFSQSSSRTLTNSATSSIYSIDITGNGEFVIGGGNQNTPYVYENNGTHFTHTYNISGCCVDHVDFIDVTADGEWLYVVDNYRSSYMHRYNFRTNQYELFQTFTIAQTTNNAGAITDDHQWLIVPKDDGWVHVYTFNGS